ncbi:MAG: dihydropteroate synthase [Chlorobi bacterium]|nr:dihydropteroate synthase [Chlorobiota bacterium]
MQHHLQFKTKSISLEKPLIIGILNLTPDSFYDGGFYKDEKGFLLRVEKMLEEGADIIDIGAVSTRPGAEDVILEDETRRLIPAIKKIAQEFPEAILSIDTYRSEVAKKAIHAGAHIINDISGGLFDPEMFQTIAQLKVPYILMHIKGTPKNMQQNPQYSNVVKEITGFFKQRLSKLKELGITGNIILDPGFGFGKSLEDNYMLLKNLSSFKDFGCPLLVGISRKSMIYKVLGTKPSEALNGTTVIHTLALLNGANILRVHDVKEAVEVVKLMEVYKGIEM